MQTTTTLKRLFSLILLFLAIISNSQAQNVNMPTSGTTTYPGGVPDGANIKFYDDGGPGSAYSNSCSSTYTFCPKTAGSIVCITFNTIVVEANYDSFEIYSGSAASGTLMNGTTSGNGFLNGLTFISNTPDGCITIKFTSDGTGTKAGWDAIVSSGPKCPNTINAKQIGKDVYVCPSSAIVPGSTNVSFDGSASTAPAGKSIDQWIWDFGDGSPVVKTNSPTTSHVFPTAPGVYVVTLSVDDNTPASCVVPTDGCPSTNINTRAVYVVRKPVVMSQSPDSVQICKGDTAGVRMIIRSESVQAKKETPNPPPLFLPDGSGVQYTSSVILKSFPTGALVTASCLPKVKVVIEHDYVSDLSMEIIAPDGKSAYLMNRTRSGATYTGDPSPGADLGTCAPSGSVQGVGAAYTFVDGGNGATVGLAQQKATATCATNNACSNPTTNDAIPTGTYLCSNVANGTSSGLSSLIGAPLNGTWTVRVTDNISINDGWMFTWDITFPGPCYGLKDATPDLSRTSWVEDLNNNNPAKITLNAGKVKSNITPSGTNMSTNDGANNLDNPTLTLNYDSQGDKVNNSQAPTFTIPGSYKYEFQYTDSMDSGRLCDYVIKKQVKVYDKPDLTNIKCSTSSAASTTMTVTGIPKIINNNFKPADIGQWEYSKDGTTWKPDSNITGITNGSTYTIYVRNSANPNCKVSKQCTVIVPIELINFKALLQNKTGVITWQTASEKNSNYFNIERSTNGKDFTSIATLEGAGNSNTLRNYGYIDANLSTGTNYYRLKQVDFDGQFTYSHILSIVNGSKLGILSIHPNPSPIDNANLTVDYMTDHDGTAIINLLSSLGQTIFSKEEHLIEGQNSLMIPLNKLNLDKGVYFIQIISNNQTEVKRLVIEGK